jgi:hypothetical protein
LQCILPGKHPASSKENSVDKDEDIESKGGPEVSPNLSKNLLNSICYKKKKFGASVKNSRADSLLHNNPEL